MKIEKRITEKDIDDAVQRSNGEILSDEAWDLLLQWQLQSIKDQQAKDTQFEIIQPKLLK